MSGDFNPYTPPQSSGEAPAPQRLWHTEETALFVQDGAVLPAIDLETGETSDDLMEVRRKFAEGGSTFSIWSLVVVLPNLLPKAWKKYLRANEEQLWLLAGTLLVLLVLHILVMIRKPALLGKCVHFRMHRNPAHEKKAIRRRRWITLVFSFSFSLMLVPVFFLLRGDHLLPILPVILTVMGLSVTGMLASGVWQYFHLPKIRYKGFSGKWLRIHGVCGKALSHLRAIESEPALGSPSSPI